MYSRLLEQQWKDDRIRVDVHPDFAACASPFYTALLAAVGECTGNKTKSTTVEELRKRVTLNHDDISRMIVRVQGRTKNLVEWWPSVQFELIADGRRALVIDRMRLRCLAYLSAARRAFSDVAREFVFTRKIDGRCCDGS